jgi:hypothetical protein
MARDLTLPVRSVTRWCNGKALPDIRRKLADLFRRHDPYDPNTERLARKLESLGRPGKNLVMQAMWTLADFSG